MKIEVTRAYYDGNDAKVVWETARKRPNAPRSWSGVEFDDRLAYNISGEIAKKYDKSYPPGCLLVVDVRPALTDALDMAERLPLVEIPAGQPFGAIYLTGTFPQSSKSPPSYHVWQLA